MGTVTQRTVHPVTDAYTDLTVSIPGAANVAGFVRNLGPTDMEIVKGGAQPAASVRGVPLRAWGDDWTQADHVWVRCSAKGDKGTVGFEAVS